MCLIVEATFGVNPYNYIQSDSFHFELTLRNLSQIEDTITGHTYDSTCRRARAHTHTHTHTHTQREKIRRAVVRTYEV